MTTSIVLDHELSGDAGAHSIRTIGAPTAPSDAARLQDVTGGSGSAEVADWDLSLVRYIFVDPINGDDTRAGYLDAAAGTVFTAPQVLAVSVKTTHRINEVRPPVGAGRMCVVLIAANAGAVLDHAASSDGLGMDDRHLRFGYQLLHTRGSNLTNSVVDRAQLGYVAATGTGLRGPGATGEWIVAAATPGAEGLTIQLTGAAFPASWVLPRYRLRALTAGGMTIYGSNKWGDITGVGTDRLLARSGPIFGIAPGDKIWIEEPGVLLDKFLEVSSGVGSRTTNSICTAGFGIVTSAVLGCNDDPTPTHYSHILAGDNATIASSANGCGDIRMESYYTDEAGGTNISNGVGVAAPSCSLTARRIDLTYSSISDRASGDALSASYLQADTVSVNASALQTCLVMGELRLNGVIHGNLYLVPKVGGVVSTMRGLTAWNPILRMQPDAGTLAAARLLCADWHNLLIIPEGSEPDSPACLLAAGQYTVIFDHGDIASPALTAGNGVRIEYDASGTKFTPLTWASLRTTGFETEGLQKVLCKMTGANYKEDMLPCPRGRVMQLPDNAPG